MAYVKVDVLLILIVIRCHDLNEAGCLEFLNSQWKEKEMGRAPPEYNASFIEHSYEKPRVFLLPVKEISKLNLN